MKDDLDLAWEAMSPEMRSHPGVMTLYRLAFANRRPAPADATCPTGLAALSDEDVMRVWDRYVSTTNAYEDNGVGFVRLLLLEIGNRGRS